MIWPTRRELGTYTTVALVFIVVMVAIVTSLDYGFTKLVFARLRLSRQPPRRMDCAAGEGPCPASDRQARSDPRGT